MDEQLRWEPPGAGAWAGDVTYKLTTVTGPFAEVWSASFEDGFRQTFERYGLPLETLRLRFVNGYLYVQPKPVGAPEGGGKGGPPPSFVLKVLSRVHPEMRRRTAAARHAFEQHQWRADAERWRGQTMPGKVATNLRLQSVDVDGLDDAALAAHVEACRANLADGARHHFSMIGAALAVGDLLATAASWGLDPDAVVPLLAGASAGSSDARDRVRRIAAEVSAAGVAPSTLDDVRAAGDLAAKELDDYLDHYGYRVVGASDLDARTLVESPEVVVRSITAAMAAGERAAEEPDPSGVRAAVPAHEQARFDRMLAEARFAYGIREEEVGITVSWTVGIYRRALLAAGERLAARKRVDVPDDVFVLTGAEVMAMLTGSGGPTLDEVASRRRARAAADAATPPPILGGAMGTPPPPDAFPAPMARAVRAMDAYRSRISAAPGRRPQLQGHGVGTATYRGVACVASTPEDALERLEPGAVLVTSITTPAFNALLPMVGAIVTQEGGVLSHPAIAARELGVAAVIGAAGVLDIPDGAVVDVDPVTGIVTVGGDR